MSGATPPGEARRGFLDRPASRSGWIAVALLGLSAVFLVLLAAGAWLSPDRDPEDFLDYVLFAFLILTLVGAAVSGLTAGVAAGHALARQRERSWLVIVALLWSLAVLFLTAVELLGHEEPRQQPPRGADTLRTVETVHRLRRQPARRGPAR